MIAGHRVTHSKPFRHIDQLAAGDEIIFVSEGVRSVYHVTEHEVVGVHGDEVRHFKAWRPLERIESDRRAGGRVPDQPGRDVDEGQATDQHHGEVRRHDVAEATHGSTLRRRRMARCCSAV